MSRLLYVESSPRKERSISIAVSRSFIEAYETTHPGDVVEKMDLWEYDLPEFNGAMIDAKYAVLSGTDMTPGQQAAWQRVADIFNLFNSADKYLISMPMWNFGVPYIFKQLVDVITQPGMAFNFSPESGYTGLVTDRPVTVVYARGGEYPKGAPTEILDIQTRYVELWLGFVGFTDIQSIIVEPTMDPSRSEVVIAAACEQARAIGRSY